mmetsp:Transcript_4859/g.14515  ORF Transcript_4859/g.14515 Transcript_4859/m.14515 type:complete len:348 (-) Transcript_4859:2349-3392(-)
MGPCGAQQLPLRVPDLHGVRGSGRKDRATPVSRKGGHPALHRIVALEILQLGQQPSPYVEHLYPSIRVARDDLHVVVDHGHPNEPLLVRLGPANVVPWVSQVVVEHGPALAAHQQVGLALRGAEDLQDVVVNSRDPVRAHLPLKVPDVNRLGLAATRGVQAVRDAVGLDDGGVLGHPPHLGNRHEGACLLLPPPLVSVLVDRNTPVRCRRQEERVVLGVQDADVRHVTGSRELARTLALLGVEPVHGRARDFSHTQVTLSVCQVKLVIERLERKGLDRFIRILYHCKLVVQPLRADVPREGKALLHPVLPVRHEEWVQVVGPGRVTGLVTCAQQRRGKVLAADLKYF